MVRERCASSRGYDAARGRVFVWRRERSKSARESAGGKNKSRVRSRRFRNRNKRNVEESVRAAFMIRGVGVTYKEWSLQTREERAKPSLASSASRVRIVSKCAGEPRTGGEARSGSTARESPERDNHDQTLSTDSPRQSEQT